MLKLSDIRLKARCDERTLRQTAAGILSVSAGAIKDMKIHRLSIDARRKSDVRFVYTLLVDLDMEEGRCLGTEARKPKASKAFSQDSACVSNYIPPEPYTFPEIKAKTLENPPVIVGMGPAGLFAALCLAEAGIKSVVLERGAPVSDRIKSVVHFWEAGVLDESSNVQFGEGGAGTFSDGKLTTSLNDMRIRYVLERLVAFGAPDDILYLAKPHIGTDRLRDVVIGMRKRLIELGCAVKFGHRLADLEIDGGKLRSISVSEGLRQYSMATDTLILAPGNSSRDTFEMLYNRGVALSPKSFSLGVRIEHLQSAIDMTQYGAHAISSGIGFPASDYKLVAHLDNGRSVYTFCVCPGGQVVAAASESGGVVTNGMSHYARDGENINGALLCSVTPDDFGNTPLGGIALQRKLERAAFKVGGGNHCAPAQLVCDFLEKRASRGQGQVAPTYLPGVKYCNLWDVLPEFICDALAEALPQFERKISGFAHPDAVLTAVETRSSSPVRIERDCFESVNVKGLFPCGEGAGYAGGIMSAAVDGIRCAEAVMIKQ
ncbi:MAG: FAD-dependent monooxygenase [Oscillospiraceae bacterium]|nr:FAD-dependent monooxygenase [Oscillospiraceae bacterium]